MQGKEFQVGASWRKLYWHHHPESKVFEIAVHQHQLVSSFIPPPTTSSASPLVLVCCTIPLYISYIHFSLCSPCLHLILGSMLQTLFLLPFLLVRMYYQKTLPQNPPLPPTLVTDNKAHSSGVRNCNLIFLPYLFLLVWTQQLKHSCCCTLKFFYHLVFFFIKLYIQPFDFSNFQIFRFFTKSKKILFSENTIFMNLRNYLCKYAKYTIPSTLMM